MIPTNNELTDKEKDILDKIRTSPPYSKITIEKRNDEVYRCVIETSFLLVENRK
mgnify:CR=1 FL=1